MTWFSSLFILAVILLLALPCSVSARDQPILRLDAPDGELVIDARPFAPNFAGSSAAAIRYRYRGITLSAVAYGPPDNPLYAWLRRHDAAQVWGLAVSAEAAWREAPHHDEYGVTLYLPPAQFSAAEVERLTGFLQMNEDVVSAAFQAARIRGRFLLGLLNTTADVHFSGIARLIHAEQPFVEAFGDDWTRVVIEHDGRIILVNTRQGRTSPPEIVTWGQMLPPRRTGGKPRLVLEPVTLQEGEPSRYDSELMKKWARSIYLDGRPLHEKYAIMP